MRTRLEITNRSRWPDGALRVISRWVCKRSGLGTDRLYYLTFRNTTCNTWGGEGCGSRQTVTLHRRYTPPDGWPYETKDKRFKWSQKEVYRSRLELLVFLIAHEAHHAGDGHPFKWYGPDRRRLRAASMEFRCNRAGLEAIRDFRDEWPRLFGEIKREIRKDRERQTKAKAAVPRRKFTYAVRMLKNWETKSDSRKTRSKIQHYRRMVIRHENRIARIMHGKRRPGNENPKAPGRDTPCRVR